MTFRPPFTSAVSHGHREIAITYLTPARFEAKPQVGVPIRQEWHSLLRWLTWPSYAEDKRAHGAWCPAALEGGAVKGGRGPASLLVADVDDCGADGLDRSVSALSPYAGCIVPTFSATRERPKHRIVLLLARWITAQEWPLAWAKFAATLGDVGTVVDRGCKNLNRLYFACVARSPEAWLGARLLTGDPVPVDAMLSAAREEHEEQQRERERQARARRPVREEHRNKYTGAALERARANIAAASEGARHDALLREAFSLARLGLTDNEIERNLLEAFVAVAGESRRFEGRRAIRDAVEARGRGAA
jgi:hypothetical protein